MGCAITHPPLAQALATHAPHLAGQPLYPLADHGLAHEHLRIGASGWLARLPKFSQMGLPPAEHLAYEHACFERAAPCGHTPRVGAVLSVTPSLPRGGLLVREVLGRAAQLPRDLPALAQALAALHALPLPASELRAPLRDAADPLADLLDDISPLMPALLAALPDAQAKHRVQQMHHGLRHLANQVTHRPSRRLIAFDAHPGNFVLTPEGRAVLVDLEKARYSYPALDLAHATLYTSTTWDMQTHASLDAVQVADAYSHWWRGAQLPEGDRAWLAPLRRAMALWSLTWCAQWLHRNAQALAPTEPNPTLWRHVHERSTHYLSAQVIERIDVECQWLEAAWGAAPAA